jgi:hypothetical protein
MKGSVETKLRLPNSSYLVFSQREINKNYSTSSGFDNVQEKQWKILSCKTHKVFFFCRPVGITKKDNKESRK